MQPGSAGILPGILPASRVPPGWRRYAENQMASQGKGFWSLIVTQFQGSFSDNALKNLVVFLVLGMGLAAPERDRLVLLAGLLFSLPFILFSMAGGYLADRFSKRAVAVGTRAAGIAVALVALAGLAGNSLPLQLAAVFLIGAQSALFSPAKYGLVPELLPPRLLSWGNGVLELGTFLAIIAGTVAGTLMAEGFAGRQMWSGAILAALAAAGLLASLGISRVPAADPARRFRANFLGDLAAQGALIRSDRVLLLAVLGNTYFWFLATLLHANVRVYGTDVLGVSGAQIGLLLGAMAFAIGLGSVAAGYLSGSKIEYGLVPLGSLGMLVAAALVAGSSSLGATGTRLALLGFFAGFFIVPINALIQHRPPAERKGGVIAAANLLSFVGVFSGEGVFYLLKAVAGLPPAAIFLAASALTLAVTAYALYLLPTALVRLLLWLASHSVYRIRVIGRDNLPARGGVPAAPAFGAVGWRGGALLVCNHLSFVDALLLIGATDRMVRFLMFQGYFDHPLIRPFARAMQAIPISSQLRPREMIRSLRGASETIKSGHLVCIFAEGQITRIGQLLPFRRGLERIMKGVEAPIIPVHLEGVWGSIFSFEKGRFLWKLPRRIPYPVTVSFGRPMPASSTALEVRQAVQELHSEAYTQHKRRLRPLQREFVLTARRHPLRFAMADARVPRLRFGAALVRAVFLARRLARVWQDQKMVGILLPPSVAGALVNFAALLTGRVPVNLNYTASDETLESCARQCGLKTVVTSQAFLERVKVRVPGQAILLEEAAGEPRLGERLAALLMAWTLPVAVLERALGRREKASLDGLATVIFSSGSTGDPKGVMLTHFNIGANIEQLGQTFLLGRKDCVLGILPFFHSFGFTGTLCLPAVLGTGVVFHPSPLDARAIGALVAQYRVTFLLATPTFLQAYLRRCSPEDFGSLQYALAGAEKLPERVAQAFEDRFGLRPLEAYGCTECSPAVTVNTRDFRAAGFRQVGAKRGTIGHPLPGVSVRIVDPETGRVLPPGEAGLLLVRGPNVMAGYLGQPQKTAEVLRDGWYTTGDIAAMDEDGFLAITDRLSRFSKIGGEMVPHIKIEEKLHEVAGLTEQAFAVTAVPNEKKGERLAVLHTLPEERLAECLARFAQSDLPNLWKPRESQFFRVEALPYLGTGKLDLRRLRELALARSQAFRADA